MKRIISLCLIMSMVLTFAPHVSADTTTSDYYEELGIWFDKNEKTITDADETLSGSLAVPEAIDGIEVTAIGMGAFANCTNLTEIIVPDTIKKVESYAFYNCTDAYIVCSEYSPALLYAIENNMNFTITNKLTSYEHFDHGKTMYGKAENSNSEYVSFEAAYQVREDMALTDKKVVIYVPKDTKLIESTIKVNGVTSTNYVYENNILTVPAEASEGKVSFCTEPYFYTEIKTYAKMDFVYEGTEKSETIGIVEGEEPYITIKADDRISTDYITVQGIAPSDSEVKIYLGDGLVETLNTYEDGVYYAEVPLTEVKNYSSYTVTAKTVYGEAELSASKKVMYEETAPVLTELVMTHNEQEYYLTDSYDGGPEVMFDSSGFKFSANFENSEKLENVCIVSTKNNRKKYMPAEWNEQEQCYVAEGYFEDTETDYVPGRITVEYMKKRPEVPVSNTLDNAEELLGYMDSSLKNCITTVTENTASSFSAKIDIPEEIRDLIGDEIDFAVKTIDKEYNDIPISELMAAGENYYSYFVDTDSEKYVLNLDLTDGETLNMVVHDIANDKQLNYILDFWDNSTPGNPSTALKISEVLGKAGFVTGTLADVYDIRDEDQDLRDKIYSSEMNDEERLTALKKADELKTDRELFLLTTTVISVATMGTAGVPAMIFGAIFGAVTTSSGFFWERRMSNILGEDEGTDCDWKPSNVVSGGTFGLYGDNLSYELTTSGVLTISGKGEMGENIPWNSYDDIRVVNIGTGVTNISSNAFKNCTGIKSINIPIGIKRIDSNAFRGCTGLTNVEIGNGVKLIGNSAFYNCTALESVYIPNNVILVEHYAFSGCTGLKSVKVGNGDTVISPYTFSNCKAIKSVVIGNGDAVIGNWTFGNCTSLESLKIGYGNVSIGESAFSGCSKLSSIETENEILSIGKYAFRGCVSLPYIEFGNINVLIGTDAFENCTGLESVTIGHGVVEIGQGAFADCTGIKSVTMGDGQKYIRNDAFYGCTGLETFTTGKGAVSIGNFAFYGCTSLTSDIPEETTSLGYMSFSGCTSLKNVNVPGSVKYINTHAFENCTGIETAIIKEGVTSIGQAMFIGCTNLKSVEIPSGVVTIGNSAFSNCSSLTSIDIPDSVTQIGDHVFHLCSALETINMSKNVNSIGFGAFYGCSALKSITIPYKVTSLSISLFSGCSNLETVNMRNNIETIGENAFLNCSKLKNIYVPNSVTSIEKGAFAECTSLSSVNIPSKVVAISEQTFFNCTNLKSVSIPQGVSDIGYSAFENCTNLSEVYYEGSDNSWSTITVAGLNEALATATVCSGVSALPEITNMEVDIKDGKAQITLTTSFVPFFATAYVASYNTDGILVQIYPVSLTDGVGQESLSADGIKTFKAFVWDMTSIKPLCTNATYTIK